MSESSAGTTKCRKCEAQIEADDEFCASCGTIRSALVVAQDPPPPAPGLYAPIDEAAIVFGKARRWLMFLAVFTLGVGLVMFAIQRSEVERTLEQVAQQTAAMAPEERDALVKQNTGMTYQEVVDHDRGMVRLLLFVNIGLAGFYLGMWFWAKKNPLGAAVVALIMFVSVTAVNGVVEPSSLYKGLPIKIFFVLALAKTIQFAMAERAGRVAAA